MNEMTRVLVINGSLRAESHTRRLLKLAIEALIATPAEVYFLDLAETPLPMFHPDRRDHSELMQTVRERVSWAEVFLIGTPDYHGSISAPIKNFLDHFWLELAGKLFGSIIASHEKGLTVQEQLRTIARQCYAWSLPYGIGFDGDVVFDREKKLIDRELADRLAMMVRDLVTYGKLISRQLGADLGKPGCGFAGGLERSGTRVVRKKKVSAGT
jgi:FMN reductase